MSLPKANEIALPAASNALNTVLRRRIQEIIAKVSKEFTYEVICSQFFTAIQARMAEECRRLEVELSLPMPLAMIQEDTDHGGRIVLFAYNGQVVGKAYLTP